MVSDFFLWVEATRAHQVISSSTWMFAVIESIHLLALSVIGGAVLMVDLRFLGIGMRRQSIPDVARDAQPWLVWSWVMMIVTGIALFVSEPTKLYYSAPFWWKMAFLVLATTFAFTVRRKVAQADEASVRPLTYKLVALVSLVLWFGVGASGRWIGFSG
jgi:hypothetical protein